MIKSYKVAGHVFCVEMPDRHPLWSMMAQYEPFEIADGSERIFILSWEQDLGNAEKTPVYVEAPEDEGQSRIELYRTAEGWRFEMAPTSHAKVVCCLDSSEDFSVAKFSTDPVRSSALFGLNNSLMLLFAFRTAGMMTLEMHSSVVVNDGKGYMFLGKSGTGKSTHSRQWLEHIPGSVLLNDDNPIIRVEDGVARVYGSPWSGKTPCYKNADAPIGAIVRIRQHPENLIRRQSVVESYASLYSSCSGLKSQRDIADGLHSTLEFVAVNVPCFVLDCRPDHEAADVCHSAVK